MLRPTVKEVVSLADYRLLLKFDNGERKIFDAKPYISGEWFKELENLTYFKSVAVDGFTVVWPHGQDLCPDDLYYLSATCTEEKGA